MITERLKRLREEMQSRGISIYIVPTSDFHESEYVGSYFKARQYVTGFTGSAGTAVITMTEAGLWTDGRYFVQAEEQLKDTTVTLYKMGEENVPSVMEFVESKLKKGQVIGFDGRVVNGTWGEALFKLAEEKEGKLHVTEDLVDLIWEDRPMLPKNPVTIFSEQYVGLSTKDKLAKLRDEMKKKGANVHLLTCLYDICWLLNVRGNDIAYVPVVLSYLAVLEEKCIWFVQKEVVTEELKDYLAKNQIEVQEYEAFYDYVESLNDTAVVLMDKSIANYRVCNCVPANVKVKNQVDPTVRMRAIKNEIEVKNTRNAHVKDAVAMCKFMYWLKQTIGKETLTEISISDKLEEFRKAQEGFIELSFSTICGYAAHGAIVHYEATKESDVEVKPEGLLLIDSGGHYMEGTTDITRAFAMGALTEEMKEDYTRTLRSNLNLANAKFLYGCTGQNLDILAREPFWEVEKDFKHGTGHGVGYILNVHEGPNGFRWRAVPERSDAGVLEEGMITTDEPGIYIEGKYGIRLENELVCRKANKNEYGQFMEFETITYVPFELEAIVKDQMTKTEVKRLNDYHKMVYSVVSPYLSEEERNWLERATREI